MNGRPVSATAATMVSQSAIVGAIGFSSRTAFPARSAATVASACRLWGRAMQTTSTGRVVEEVAVVGVAAPTVLGGKRGQAVWRPR